jgi:predicted metal-dependent HD superfamily phosphohydrolase
MTSAWTKRFAALCSGVPGEAALLGDLATRYAEPHRAYHGLAHLDALAQLYAQVERGPGWIQPAEVKLAISFHDAIYEPGRSDNEARSAALAGELLEGWPVDVDRIQALILATANHAAGDVSGDHDLAHFLDADMAIIGAPPEVYDAYAQGVRREFSTIPAAMFRAGRRAFVTAQLARASLFHTRWFRDRYERPARANLARELASLV